MVFESSFVIRLALCACTLIALSVPLSSEGEDLGVQTPSATVLSSTLQISGMTCSSCERQITKALQALPGVSVISVDHATGTAVFQYDSALIQISQIQKAVTDAGYTVGAPAQGHSSGTP